MRRTLDWLAILVGMASIVAVTAHATALGHSDRAAEQVALDPVPEGKALVYLFNASGYTLIGGSQTFKVDDRRVAKLRRDEHGSVALDPGRHTFEAASRAFDLPVEAGKRYFVVYAYHPEKSWVGPLAGRPDFFGAVTEEEARALLAKSRRPAATAPPTSY